MALHTFNSLGGFSVGGNYAEIIDSSGNIFGNNISTTGNLTVGGQVNIISGIISSNTIIAGQLTAAQIFSNGNISGSNITTAGKITGGDLVISGNTTTANVFATNRIEANTILSNSNISAINILASDQIIANGNITGNFLFGDGSLIANLPAGNYSNANVSRYLPVYTGNMVSLTGDVITTANIQGNYLNGNGAYLTGLYSNSNVSSYLPIYSGNISSGNIVATGNISAQYFTGNINSSNIVSEYYSGNIISVTGNITTVSNISASYYIGNGSLLSNLSANNISGIVTINNGGTGANTSNDAINNLLPSQSGSAGTFLTTDGGNTSWANITTDSDVPFLYAWANTQSVPTNSNYVVLWNNIPTNTTNLNYSAGKFSNPTTGNITMVVTWQNQFSSGGSGTTNRSCEIKVYDSFNVEIDNFGVEYDFVAPGADFNSSSATFVLQPNYSFVLVVNQSSGTTLTIGGTSGAVKNTLLTASVLKINTIYSYGNANVANYLPTFTGNISANYFIGDGSLLSNVNVANVIGNYGNSNVANYLPTYNGTIQSNVVVLGDGVDTISQASWFKTQTNSISNTILYEVSSNSVSSLDFNITATSGNNRQVVKIMSVVINNTYDYSEYGSLTLGNDLGNFVVDLVAGNLQLYVDPFTSNVIDYTVVVNAYS